MRFLSCTLVLLLIACGCSAGVLVEDERVAAAQAVQFMETVVTASSLDDAYRHIDPIVRRSMSREKFEKKLETMPMRVRSGTLAATDYGAFPYHKGKGYTIYVQGQNDQGVVYFSVVMKGDVSRGYDVVEFLSEDGPPCGSHSGLNPAVVLQKGK